jgi:tetratricopeptide (TPR) repeat protein
MRALFRRETASFNNHRLLASIAIGYGILVFLSYFGNGTHQLLHWDDLSYISANSWVTNPTWQGLYALFTGYWEGNWHPITWLSFIPEYYFCQEAAWCYKSTNILLHACNAFMVFIVSRSILSVAYEHDVSNHRKIIAASILAGALFAVHTQHVESVIWVAERKDLLCALFYLLSVFYYIKLHTGGSSRYRDLVLLFFFCSLLSKPMAVTLPFTLVILDFYPLKRFELTEYGKIFGIVFTEKLILYLLSASVVTITLLAQSAGITDQPTFFDRLIISASAISHYCLSFFYLIDFSPFYPSSLIDKLFVLHMTVFAMIVVAITVASIKFNKPFIAAISFFFLASLPVIGLIKVGEHAYADRYTYIPMIGFYILIAWTLIGFFYRFKHAKPLIAGCIAISIGLMGFQTHDYKNVWESDLVIWTYISNLYAGESSVIHNNLGGSYFQATNYEQALEQFERARSLEPDNISLYKNKVLTLKKLKRDGEILPVYKQAIENNPDNHVAHLRAAEYYLEQTQTNLAHQHYVNALAIYSVNPKTAQNDPEGLFAIARALFRLGDLENAEVAVRIVSTWEDNKFQAMLIFAEGYLAYDKSVSLKVLADMQAVYGNNEKINDLRQKIQSQ